MENIVLKIEIVLGSRLDIEAKGTPGEIITMIIQAMQHSPEIKDVIIKSALAYIEEVNKGIIIVPGKF